MEMLDGTKQWCALWPETERGRGEQQLWGGGRLFLLLDRELRTFIHVKRAKRFDPVGLFE